MAEERVWRWNGGGALVGWNYLPMARTNGGLIPLNLEAPEVRRVWLRELLARFPSVLGDFGYPTKARVTAWRIGEEACVVDWRTHVGRTTLLDFVATTDAVHEVYAHLTLTCLDKALEPFEIEWGAGLIVSFALTESGALNTAMPNPVYLSVDLYADPYAPISRGPVRDNSVLAALNGPRLTSFLERIERDVPAQLLEIDEEMYRGAVGPHGFLPPPSPPSA